MRPEEPREPHGASRADRALLGSPRPESVAGVRCSGCGQWITDFKQHLEASPGCRREKR